jgi:imidazoleglycerol phosphate dehydratase HisB
MNTVKLTIKQTGRTQFFKSCADIYKEHSVEDVGICLEALWNAISPSKGNGRYENGKCVIERKTFKNWN